MSKPVNDTLSSLTVHTPPNTLRPENEYLHAPTGISAINHERVDRELQELIPVETDVNVLHLTDWDDTTEYVRKEGLAIYVNPSPYPRG